MKPRSVRTELLMARINSIAASGVFSNHGPQACELEERYAQWLGVEVNRVVATSSGTTALGAAFFTSPAKGWHVPAWSFPATALAPLSVGKSISFVDVDYERWMVQDERRDEEVGLVNVIPFGGSFSQDAWDYRGHVIVDAAASLASRPGGLKSLPRTAAVVFSLHATKTMGGGEGGLVVFGDNERASLARAWTNFGFSQTRESIFIGTNGKISEYDAAVANARLDGWHEEENDWAKVRQMTSEAYLSLGLASKPASLEAIGPYWIAVFDDPEASRLAQSFLGRAGVQTKLWWARGLHKMAAFSEISRYSLSNIDDIAGRYLGLPFFVDMTQREIDHIVDCIEAAL